MEPLGTAVCYAVPKGLSCPILGRIPAFLRVFLCMNFCTLDIRPGLHPLHGIQSRQGTPVHPAGIRHQLQRDRVMDIAKAVSAVTVTTPDGQARTKVMLLMPEQRLLESLLPDLYRFGCPVDKVGTYLGTRFYEGLLK